VRPVLIDGRPLQGDSAARGIGTYLRGLLQGMGEIGFSAQISLLLSRGQALRQRSDDLGFPAGAWLPRLERRAQVLADPLLVARALSRARPRLYHAVEQGQPLRSRVPVVVTVHDLIPFLLPGYSRRSRLLRRPGMLLIRGAEAVITPSQATARDCARLTGVDAERIHVVPHGLSPEYRPAPEGVVAEMRRRFDLPRPYLLAVGTFEPYKGLPALVAATRRLRRDHDLDLVVAGSQGFFAPAVRAELARLGRHGRELGFVRRSDLVALFSGATAFVSASAYEGFGLPLLEAMGCGAVAVAFANSSLPEVAGDAALLVEGGGGDALAGALARLLGDPSEVDRRRRRGLEHAAGFTWAGSARRTVSVYEGVLGAPLLD
jgi:glycosyltransferase involved in cell wall biosynthesis